jgi:TRAP-type mannitol/chloroaromatic compound transport system substrate-binding protein
MTEKNTDLTRRKALVAGAALIAAPAIIGSSSARAQEKVVWKVQSHWPKASSSYGDSLQVIADELAEITNGRFTMELHGAGEFAKGAEIFQIVKKGVVEMGTISPGYILGEAPMAGLCLGVPGTFRDPWEFQYYLKNMGAEAMFNEELAYHGVVSRAEKVYPTELVVTKEIAEADDFSAMKLRSSGSYLTYLEAAGAAPQYVAGPELYQSLASGVVDGAHWGAAQGAKSMSLWEVAKYHMKPTMGLAMDTLIMNKAAIDALPEDLRFTLMQHLETRFWKRCAEYQYKEIEALAAGIAEQGVQVKQFPQGVLDKFAEASRAILEEERAKGGNATKGTEMLVEFLKTLGYA